MEPIPTSSSSSPPPPPPPPLASTEAASKRPARGSDEDRSPLALLRRALDLSSNPSPPSATLIRALCRRLGVIPNDLRARVWPILLLRRGTAATADEGEGGGYDVAKALREVALDLPNQRVVEVDALRTRSELACFRESPEVQRRVERLLTYYCKTSGITYKQGLNEVAAPFIYIALAASGGKAQQEEGESEALALKSFTRFIRLFLRNMYTDEDFKAMQCAFGLFRLLLLYHSPLLSARLDRAGFQPELYLTPWLLTVFARTLDMDTTLQLWDQYILEDDPLLHFFVVLAFLRRHEAALLACGEDTLPESISNLRFTSHVEVKALIADALSLKADTPESYCRRLFRICNHDLSPTAELDRLLPALGDAMVLGVTPKEALRGVADHLEFVLQRGAGTGKDGQQDASADAAAAAAMHSPALTPDEEAMTASSSSSSASSSSYAVDALFSPAGPPSPLRPPNKPPRRQPREGSRSPMRAAPREATEQQRRRHEGAGWEEPLDEADDSLTRTRNDAREQDEELGESTEPTTAGPAAEPAAAAVAGATAARGAGGASSSGPEDAICTRALAGSVDGQRRRHAFIFCDCRPRHLYDRFRIDSALHLDPALLLPRSQQQPGEKGGEDELTAFLVALQRAWGGLAHVCIVPTSGVDGAPSKSHPESTAARFIQAFLAQGFARVSYLEGGMEAFVHHLEDELLKCGGEEGPEKENGEADKKTGPKQRQQQEREERQRREVLEAVLAVGPPVRSRSSERDQNDGASKASIFRRLFGGGGRGLATTPPPPAASSPSPSTPRLLNPSHPSATRSPQRTGQKRGALYAALMAGATPDAPPQGATDRQGGGRAGSPSFQSMLPSLFGLAAAPAATNSTSAAPGPPPPGRPSISPTPFLSRLASRLSLAAPAAATAPASSSNPFSPFMLASPSTDQEAMRLLANAAVVDVREWVESGGGRMAKAKQYHVHRQLPSGRLSGCRLVLSPDARLLLGAEIPGMSSCLRVLEGRSLAELNHVTKKKRVRNAIRLHFDRFAVQPDGADGPRDAACPAGAKPQEREQQQQHRRGLSSSLSSTVTGPAPSEQGDVPPHDVIELFSTEYLAIVDDLKRLVQSLSSGSGGAAGAET